MLIKCTSGVFPFKERKQKETMRKFTLFLKREKNISLISFNVVDNGFINGRGNQKNIKKNYGLQVDRGVK